MSRRVARVAPIAVSILALGLWAWLALQRAPYPFELEWMEGGMLAHVNELRAGRGLFVEPRIEFAPFPYTPAFAHIGAVLPQNAASPFLPLRLVSVVSSVVLFTLIGALAAVFARRAGPSRTESSRTGLGRTAALVAGVLAAGFAAAGNEFTGVWLDIARVDALSLALAFAAWWMLVRADRASFVVAATAGLLAALAVLTKQSALLFSGALIFAAWQRGRQTAFVYACVLLASLFAAWIVLQSSSQGMAKRWIFDLLSPMRVHEPAKVGYFVESGLALGAGVLVILAAVKLAGHRYRWSGALGPVLALVVTGYIGRLHQGGFDNNLAPALFGVAVLFGPAAACLLDTRRTALASLAVTLAFAPLIYDPRPYVPTAEDRVAGAALVERIKGLDAPVLIPDHGYLARRAFGADAQGSMHAMVMVDLTRSTLEDWAQTAVQDLQAALARGDFGALLLSDRSWESGLPVIQERYLPPIKLWPDGDTRFFTVTGTPKRPEWLYLRR